MPAVRHHGFSRRMPSRALSLRARQAREGRGRSQARRKARPSATAAPARAASRECRESETLIRSFAKPRVVSNECLHQEDVDQVLESLVPLAGPRWQCHSVKFLCDVHAQRETSQLGRPRDAGSRFPAYLHILTCIVEVRVTYSPEPIKRQECLRSASCEVAPPFGVGWSRGR